jgi:hypothetical protein
MSLLKLKTILLIINNMSDINDYLDAIALMSLNYDLKMFINCKIDYDNRGLFSGGIFAEIASCIKYDDIVGDALRILCDGAIVRTENKYIRFINGKINSFIDNPTEVIYYGKNIWLNWKNNNDEFHREDGPSQVHYSDMILESESWSINGRFHRVGGPAYISYQNDKVISEIYLLDGFIVLNNENTLF